MKKVILVVAVLMIAVMLTTLFVACSAEDYKKQYTKKGYDVQVASDSLSMVSMTAILKSSGLNIKGDLEFIVLGMKEDSIVTVLKFENASDAKALRKEAKNDKDDSVKVKVGGTGKVVKIQIDKK